MSIWRQFRRRAARKTGKEWPAASTPYKSLKDGGYKALHATKGWRRFSGKRLRAQARLRAMQERIIAAHSIRRRIGARAGAQ